MTITAKKFNLALIIALSLTSIGAIGISFYALKVYESRSSKLVSSKLEIVEINTKIENAMSQKAELVKNKNNIELLQKIVPKSKDQALAVAELQAIANEINVSIGSISFPSSELGTNKNSSGNTNQKITQTKTIDGISGVLGIELNISQLNKKLAPSGSGISYDQMIKLLESIEKNRRTMQIKNVQIQPIIKNSSVSGYSPTITINLFVKP